MTPLFFDAAKRAPPSYATSRLLVQNPSPPQSASRCASTSPRAHARSSSATCSATTTRRRGASGPSSRRSRARRRRRARSSSARSRHVRVCLSSYPLTHSLTDSLALPLTHPLAHSLTLSRTSFLAAGARGARPHAGALPHLRPVRGASQGERARARHLQVRPRHAAALAGAGALQEVRAVREAARRPQGYRRRHQLQETLPVRGAGPLVDHPPHPRTRSPCNHPPY